MPEANILIVDDEGIVVMDITARLKSLGYAVAGSAASGAEAMRLVEDTRPDLVLMDIKLVGGADGIETAAQIRTRFDIPIIYVTAYADEATLQRAKVAEPYGYIIKPFEERELHSAIQIALYRHQIEARLRQNEQWLAITLRSIDNAVIATDQRGIIRLMNPVAEALTGWTLSEAIGHDLAEVCRIANEKRRADPVDVKTPVLRGSSGVRLPDYSLLQVRQGGEIPIAGTAAPMKDEAGHMVGLVLVFRNITQQRQLEQELLRVQKLESVGLLAGGIAHDFNNVLTSILGNIGLARVSGPVTGEVPELLSKAESMCLSARRLTSQLLIFAKGGAPVRKAVSISHLIRDSAQFALPGSRSRCEFRIPDDVWPVEADESLLSQVISNLIIHADRSMPQGGTILVTCENVSVEPQQAVPASPGRYVRLSIADQGAGLSEEERVRIFDPYFNDTQAGRGLGLAVTYSVVKAHGGYIEVSSQPGVGSTFHAYLPAEPAQQPEIRTQVARQILAGTGRILVMDDDRELRDMTGRVLHRAGYEVAFAQEGGQAITMYEAALTSGSPFDAVIVDLTVPGGMGGRETMHELLKIDPDVKAIVTSGYSDDPIIAHYRQYGFRGSIRKPFDISELCQAVLSVITGA
jgi:two-component system, cell cycle sensor histidine kinase and response regulator CckA